MRAVYVLFSVHLFSWQLIHSRCNHKLIFIDKKYAFCTTFSRENRKNSNINVRLHPYAILMRPCTNFFYEICHILCKDGIITHFKQRRKMWNMPLKWLTTPLSPLQLKKRVSHNAASVRRASITTANVWT